MASEGGSLRNTMFIRGLIALKQLLLSIFIIVVCLKCASIYSNSTFVMSILISKYGHIRLYFRYMPFVIIVGGVLLLCMEDIKIFYQDPLKYLGIYLRGVEKGLSGQEKSMRLYFLQAVAMVYLLFLSLVMVGIFPFYHP